MRLFFALMFSIALAFHSVANAFTFDSPCPMEMGEMANGEMVQMDMSGGDHDCCNDLETYLKTGQMCKTGQTCSSVGAALLSVIPIFAAISFETVFPPDIQPPPFSVYPIAVWRPPTLS